MTSTLAPPRSRRQAGLRVWVASLALLLSGAAMAQADATIDQVYQAARQGHLAQALQMMEPVLRDHPNSAKAHYVEAELLAREGRTAQAREELGTAERLAPGLPFAHADSVQDLRRELSAAAEGPLRTAPVTVERRTAAPEGGHWGIAAALLGGALLAWLLSRLGRPQPAPVATVPAAGPGASMSGSWPPPAWPPAAAPPATAAPGLGQQVAGGLATGLAVGAGMVAAESLAHRLFSDGASPAGAAALPMAVAEPRPGFQDFDPRMGGNDFGIDDTGSWDDAGGLPGGDWDT